ncbi:hypothetical protein M406DRAFT_67943 [Cryphonectria parasitica EP155]|uniref:Protein ZIP4 homolog n=1 Tax=Cryphonectria parasitica (strain ATCC 38755 / EP155) TaxID=660469 RepID=A0A9P4Y1Z7_CRYP1|nr:uncharacterized protein M406DRAFT_67943 [Cryphonectria parasitica EP155]KAF3765502.1 hypothetical protein M406DRAFT_67943 [Cryphonectria parasitica EP155]
MPSALKHLSILAFASDLSKRLPKDKDDTEVAASLLSEVQTQMQSIGRYADKMNHGMTGDEDLEREGTNLWNLCTRLNRAFTDKGQKTSPAFRLVLAGRVLAYQILHLCQWSSKNTAHITTHLMRIALKAAKCCTGSFILQRAADYHDHLKQLAQVPGQDHDDESTRLEAEWTAMRIVLAFQDNQLVVAEHTFTNVESLLKRVRPQSAEKILDSLFQVGKGLLIKHDYPMAEKWLQRAWDLINAQPLPDISRDAIELRMAILQGLVTALIGLQTGESIERAAEIFDGDAYGSIIRRMIRSFRPNDTSFKLLCHHIHVLHTKCPGIGYSVIDDFLTSLVQTCNQEWIDAVVVKRIDMATRYRDIEGTVDEAHKSLSRLMGKPLGSEASFAAQTLIWKKVNSNFNQAQYHMADKWCLLGLRDEFANSGPTNKAKLERSIFFSMPQETQKEPMTQYLLYRVAIRSGYIEMASQCLNNVAESDIGFEFLYACVADSQRVGEKVTIVQAMKKLAETYDYERPERVHLPALRRCTIMLLHGLLGSDEKVDKDGVVMDLCSMFEDVATAVQKEPKGVDGAKLFDIRELEWFCQNAYNLGLQHASDWNLRNVVRMLTACVELASHFPDDIAAEMASDLSLRSIFCNFLIASALVALARAGDNVEQQLQDYLVARRHIAVADHQIEMRLQDENIDEISAADLKARLAQLLAFDFEAAVELKRYSELSEIVLKANQCHKVEPFKAMADCALRNNLPAEELFSVLRKIINQIAELSDSDSIKLAKYTRCLFQVTLPLDEELGSRLLNETHTMVKDAYRVSESDSKIMTTHS